MMNHVCKMINHIEQSCGISSIKAPTIIYEDNTAFVRLYQEQYDWRHNFQVIFPAWLEQSGEINLQTKSFDNLADLFTKSQPAS